jgi:hypothetical protein
MTAVHPTAFKQQVAKKKKKKKKKKNLQNRSPPAYATLAGGLINFTEPSVMNSFM